MPKLCKRNCKLRHQHYFSKANSSDASDASSEVDSGVDDRSATTLEVADEAIRFIKLLGSNLKGDSKYFIKKLPARVKGWLEVNEDRLKREEIKRKALDKLTDEEKEILGIR